MSAEVLETVTLFCVQAATVDFCLSPVFPGRLPSPRPTGVGGEVTKEPRGTLCPFWRAHNLVGETGVQPLA